MTHTMRRMSSSQLRQAAAGGGSLSRWLGADIVARPIYSASKLQCTVRYANKSRLRSYKKLSFATAVAALRCVLDNIIF